MIFESTPDIRHNRPKSPFVLSYLDLRKAVGIIGCSMPLLLIVGRWVSAKDFIFEPSISDYYYTNMGDVFVGCLCAIGLFLMSNRGYDRRDVIAGHVAFLFALGVAFFPTTDKSHTTHEPAFISTVHITSAALLFTTLAYFCLFLFTETMSPKNMTHEKETRNAIYRWCGGLILGSIALIVVFKTFDVITTVKPVLIFETIAIEAFGYAWLIKGEAFFKDREISNTTRPVESERRSAVGSARA